MKGFAFRVAQSGLPDIDSGSECYMGRVCVKYLSTLSSFLKGFHKCWKTRLTVIFLWILGLRMTVVYCREERGESTDPQIKRDDTETTDWQLKL